MKFTWMVFFLTYGAALLAEEIPDFRMRRVDAGQFYTVKVYLQGDRRVYYKTVITRPYQLSATEVTVGQWKAVMGGDAPNYEKEDDKPVTSVSYREIQEFISRLNKKTTGKSYRLPTYAEWQLAAAGTGQSGENQTFFHWGNDEKKSSEYAWTYANANGNLQRVGTLKPNRYGIYDLWGNAGEWVSDGRTDMSYMEPRLGNKGDGSCSSKNDPIYCFPENHILTDPKGEQGADRFRVIVESVRSSLYPGRAGSYYYAYPGDYKSRMLGFRLARDAD
ncbi:MAG TPA: formylglycine-generating enzyme family protein [Leptospiraceae bacterium]|nr:formylglycine-generating enzyme family protein [Leptospiraceae bacterium]HNF12830.1 formylglycine-generating enzyme family protein [Leptospiraceae bacterium]HNI25091.1 formylglycine-generating enzyme family protein [Leptospiraceae bacterium]HNI99475.1 formylglycine-generating enzyme family protein [Leptospiraceae bacterium]HNM02978.1 formylglycine-generating enzyme family protein [Leptospiraceae bacterium]